MNDIKNLKSNMKKNLINDVINMKSNKRIFIKDILTMKTSFYNLWEELYN